VDSSNVASDSILLLPFDPDASAARLRSELEAATGARLGVVISDTAGRAWRIGQTDQAIGASGVQVIERYAGQQDAYGNELQVTAIAIADELAAAADLAKTKLAGRPVAVVRGLERYVCSDTAPAGGQRPETSAALLVRDAASDMFRYGSREAVVAAVLEATGQGDRYEAVLGHASAESMVAAVLDGSGRTGGEAELLRRILVAALG
jgi:coenzyme F420-0:L-glutamate ligase/coenzyme F420-1:gamma-L-glutamate ligase